MAVSTEHQPDLLSVQRHLTETTELPLVPDQLLVLLLALMKHLLKLFILLAEHLLVPFLLILVLEQVLHAIMLVVIPVVLLEALLAVHTLLTFFIIVLEFLVRVVFFLALGAFGQALGAFAADKLMVGQFLLEDTVLAGDTAHLDRLTITHMVPQLLDVDFQSLHLLKSNPISLVLLEFTPFLVFVGALASRSSSDVGRPVLVARDAYLLQTLLKQIAIFNDLALLQ
mmetsp:Transcript_23461/g.23116  ORF Transcript_23461/g.23116 Transcript_23461/m.23116 type:complete len:227 (-) Transcript_23461:382-1062(-)